MCNNPNVDVFCVYFFFNFIFEGGGHFHPTSLPLSPHFPPLHPTSLPLSDLTLPLLKFVFVYLLNAQINSYGHVETVSSSNHTFLLCALASSSCRYYKNSSLISEREALNGRKNISLSNLRESIGPGLERTCGP